MRGAWIGAFASAAVLAPAHPQSPLGGDDFGRGVLGGVDVDRDGRADVFVLEGRWGEPCRVWVMSGRTGAVLRMDDGDPARDSVTRSLNTTFNWVGDVDGDGVHDYAYDLGQWREGGRVVVHSGRTGARLWAYPERWADGSAGMSVAPLGDVDGDGQMDFVLGLPYLAEDEKQRGRCLGVSGRSRATLFTVEGRVAGARFGHVRPLDDLDRDGKREFVAWGKGQAGEPGAIGVFRGEDGRHVGWLQTGSGRAPNVNGVTTGFDWNADGVGDVFVGCRGCSRMAPDREEVHIFSGLDWSELLVVPEPPLCVSRSTREEFGRSVTVLRDRFAPAGTQLVVAAYNSVPYGILYSFLGRSDGTSAELRVVGPTEFEIPAEIEALEEALHIGGTLVNAGDLDGDGADDLLVSSTASSASQRGIAWALSGRTGGTLFRWHRRVGFESPIVTVAAPVSPSK